MFAFDNSLAEYLTPSLGNEDENDISPPKTPDYRCSDEKCNQEIDVFKDKKDDQNPSKPITSRPRPSNLCTSPRATHQA